MTRSIHVPPPELHPPRTYLPVRCHSPAIIAHVCLNPRYRCSRLTSVYCNVLHVCCPTQATDTATRLPSISCHRCIVATGSLEAFVDQAQVSQAAQISNTLLQHNPTPRSISHNVQHISEDHPYTVRAPTYDFLRKDGQGHSPSAVNPVPAYPRRNTNATRLLTASYSLARALPRPRFASAYELHKHDIFSKPHTYGKAALTRFSLVK